MIFRQDKGAKRGVGIEVSRDFQRDDFKAIYESKSQVVYGEDYPVSYGVYG